MASRVTNGQHSFSVRGILLLLFRKPIEIDGRRRDGIGGRKRARLLAGHVLRGVENLLPVVLDELPQHASELAEILSIPQVASRRTRCHCYQLQSNLNAPRRFGSSFGSHSERRQ